MATKLILIEGIPGSGKTSTAQFVSEWLTTHGYTPRLFLEGDWQHPADFESIACLTDQEYAEIQAEFPDAVALLQRYMRRELGEWFCPYAQLAQENPSQTPADLQDRLAQFDVYSLPADKHQRLLRQRWQDFVQRAAHEDAVYIFECCFLQNPLTTLLAWHNQSLATIRYHIWALAEIVAVLEPKLVYLAQTDPHATLEKARQERPQAWAEFVTWYLTEQTYGQEHGLQGFAGVVDFYTQRQVYELEWLQSLPVSSLILTDNKLWEVRHSELINFLSGVDRNA